MRTILFVCEGNAIRSIMAEAIFNAIGKKDYKAKSAGTLPASKIDPKTIEVLKERHMRIIKEAPTPLNYDDIVAAHRLILMGDLLNFPSFVPEETIIQWDIKDPVGKEIKEYRQTRDKIATAVKEIIKKLK